MTDSHPTFLLFLEDGELRYVTLIKAYGWNSQSIALWGELTRYRLVNAHYCKDTKNKNEHEFVIYEFVDEHKKKLVLRTDRHVGAHKDTPSPSCTASPVINGGLSPVSSLLSPSSGSSFPLSSVNENGSKASPSSPHNSPSYPSDISSNQHLAKDTIQIERHPHRYEALKTITFKGGSSLRPSLWDVVVLAWVVHNDGPFYNLLVRQCYWFADTLFGTLEKWANGSAAHGEHGKVKRGRRQASIGCYGGVRIYIRNPEDITKIWDKFRKERQVLTQKMEQYERERTEVETMKRRVKRLESESENNKREWEETERQRRKEGEEEVKNLQAENRLLRQELARLRLESQQKDRNLQLISAGSGDSQSAVFNIT